MRQICPLSSLRVESYKPIFTVSSYAAKLHAMKSLEKPSKNSYHHGDLRHVLLDEAAKQLREKGESGLSMRRLAAQVGVSHTAPYHHFKDKQELLCGIAEEGFRRFVGIFSLDGEDLSAPRLERFIGDYLSFSLENAEYYDLMFGSQLWKSAIVTETLHQEAHAAFRFYLDQVRAWKAQGLIEERVEPLRYAQVSWSTLHGMSRLLIDGVYVDRSAMTAMCSSAANMFWRELHSA